MQIIANKTLSSNTTLSSRLYVSRSSDQRSQVVSFGGWPNHWVRTNCVGGDVDSSSFESKRQSRRGTCFCAMICSGHVPKDEGSGPWCVYKREQWKIGWIRTSSGNLRRYATCPTRSTTWKGPKNILDNFGCIRLATERWRKRQSLTYTH